MEFSNFNFFILIIFLIWIFIISYWAFLWYKKQENINKNFFWLKKWKKYYIKFVFLYLSFLLIFFSIFGLKTWQIWENKSKWIDIVFVLDVSKSMNVADIKNGNYVSTRLDFSKQAIADFVSKHKEDRFWLVIFAWDAVSSVPLTNDHNIFLTFLQNVDYKNLTKQGSDFEKALDLWTKRLSYSEDRNSALIFISDWADEDYKVSEENLKDLKNDKIKYFVAWVWTKDWWKIISWQTPFWDLVYQKYNWNYVISKLNEGNLKKVNNILWWKYLKLDNFSDINNFSYDLEKLEKKVLLYNSVNVEKDFSRILAIFAFIFFLIFLSFYIFEKK